MRQFITDASHELRTPLAAIQGYAELTRQDAAVLPETTEYSLARIEAESARMNTLVSDLLFLARVDERQDLESTDVDLAELTVNAVNDAAVSAPTHRLGDQRARTAGPHARRSRETPPGHRQSADQRRRPHSGRNDRHDKVSTGADTSIELTVADDGPGIDGELLPHLFERFVRADKSRSREAGHSGLGLAIAASIVEAHGGNLAVESGAGRTVFTIRLPLATADEAGTAAELMSASK